MTEVRRLPVRSAIEREASEWIARLAAEDVSESDRRSFAAWKAAHSMHARVYEEMQATLQEFQAAGPLVQAISFGQAIIAAGRPHRRRLSGGLAAAAVLAVVVITGISWRYLGRSAETFQTAIGEHATVTLPDSSTVELNADGLARVEYSKSARVVRLERGEAYFKVSHDTGRPFWVIAAGSWVRAVGTAFDVEIRPASVGVRVTVSEGTVKVGSALSDHDTLAGSMAQTSAAILSAGEQVDLDGQQVVFRKIGTAEVSHSLAWRTGTLFFENQPLSEVVAKLNRDTPLKIIVRDPRVARLPVGGSFQANAQGAEALVNMLRDGFGLKVHRQDDRIYVDPPTSGADATTDH